jgi:class 3 adenylate cyclase
MVDQDRLRDALRSLKDGLREVITARVAGNFEPEKLQRLAELGIIDATVLKDLPDDVSYQEAIRRFRDQIAEVVADAPSILGRLEVRPFDMLPADADLDSADAAVDLAVVFSDLEGFTSFTRDRGDASARSMLTDHYEAVNAIVRSRGGRVLKTIGDGHMIRFEEPAASVMACVDLVEMNESPLPLRVGGHFGPVIPTGADLLGHVVNVASRVADLAEGGQSLVTSRLRDAAGRLPYIVFDAPQHASVQGLHDPVEVCKVHRSV